MRQRSVEKQAFLAKAGWDHASRKALAGDASDRQYERLILRGARAVLMDAPLGKTDDPAQFVAIAAHLRGLGLSAPHAIAQDLSTGFLLLEDLGDGLFSRLTSADPARELALYEAATDVLIHLQAGPVPPELPNPTSADWALAAAISIDWYRFAVLGDRIGTEDFVQALTSVLTRYADGPRVMILRDYHAENLLWLPDRTGLARVGLLDFQLAQAGQPGYDLVSMLQDARRDVHPQTEDAMVRHFASAKGQSMPVFLNSYAALGAQRALRILGVFARLCLVSAKPGYVGMLPRVWDHLQRNLARPGLDVVARACAVLPPPTPEALRRIEAQCGAFR